MTFDDDEKCKIKNYEINHSCPKYNLHYSCFIFQPLEQMMDYNDRTELALFM